MERDPGVYFNNALDRINDEAVFSEDQINALRAMILELRTATNLALHNQSLNRRST